MAPAGSSSKRTRSRQVAHASACGHMQQWCGSNGCRRGGAQPGNLRAPLEHMPICHHLRHRLLPAPSAPSSMPCTQHFKRWAMPLGEDRHLQWVRDTLFLVVLWYFARVWEGHVLDALCLVLATYCTSDSEHRRVEEMCHENDWYQCSSNSLVPHHD